MIIAGFGFRKGASLQSLSGALTATGIDPQRVGGLATLMDKLPLLEELGADLALPVIGVDPVECALIDTPTQSEASHAARGISSVCEAVALAAAGPGARLLTLRCRAPDSMATCAIAEGGGT